ncbi:hypothetical protein OS493_022134 [Desmophyllum pertusum]|uniref:PHD-type domain-containing protein n=1 Tax=Desmophyllum pertusum TaxID=174260 RepID=A0A9X0CLA3_9CNID|nr:hypothetical protein OS493_022134 [Desmophyllum pertusum]
MLKTITKPANAEENTDIVTNEGENVKEHENDKEAVKTESAVSAGTDDKTAEDSNKNKKKPKEEGQQEDDSDADSSAHDEEEFNEDSDYDPEYDPDRLWCVCRKPHGNRFMICCDHCEEWFHGMCVGITMAQGRQMEKNGQDYVCPKCKVKITEESNKEATPTSETTAKENEQITATSPHVDAKEEKKPSPTPEHHRHRRELKMKIPGDREETRKRRHSSHRRSRDEMLEEYSYKRSKESDKLYAKLQSKDERRKSYQSTKASRFPRR